MKLLSKWEFYFVDIIWLYDLSSVDLKDTFFSGTEVQFEQFQMGITKHKALAKWSCKLSKVGNLPELMTLFVITCVRLR